MSYILIVEIAEADLIESGKEDSEHKTKANLLQE